MIGSNCQEIQWSAKVFAFSISFIYNPMNDQYKKPNIYNDKAMFNVQKYHS